MDDHRDRGAQHPPAPPRRHEPPDGAEPVTSIGGDDFYVRTQSIGFDYGDAFRSVQTVTAGEDWAVAEIAIPTAIADEIDHFRFHPALVDGAFQTLFGAPFLGQEESEEPYLPTRIRHCAVYGAPEEHMRVHVDVVSATREQVECDITITDRAGKPLAIIDGFTVQSLSASSRMSPDRIDKGLFEIQWCVSDETNTAADDQHANQPRTRPGSSSSTIPASVRPSPKNSGAAATRAHGRTPIRR